MSCHSCHKQSHKTLHISDKSIKKRRRRCGECPFATRMKDAQFQGNKGIGPESKCLKTKSKIPIHRLVKDPNFSCPIGKFKAFKFKS